MARPGDRALALALAALTAEAGRLILEIAKAGAEGRLKGDGSPVTLCDERAEEFLLEGLAGLLPGVPVVAEESASRGVVPAAASDFLLVDPLDGTKEFIAGRDCYTVNVGLIAAGEPVAGALHAPAQGRSWAGAADAGAWGARHDLGAIPAAASFFPIATRPPAVPPVALTSHSHMEAESLAFLDRIGAGERRPVGSSLKFAEIAEGLADVYPRFGPTMEWDTAAGHAVLAAAGGVVLTPGGQPFRYGHAERGYRNGPFVAWGRDPGPDSPVG
ncbi:MAG TPA: 3'(2'),5'-bisphosphate nucleotidase CysQ [Hyphomicrobiales bacterium]|nr:3'(2'),5'-bisphosphate nucleotidase CysQ [Hyphomicrobiales bacterium]